MKNKRTPFAKAKGVRKSTEELRKSAGGLRKSAEKKAKRVSSNPLALRYGCRSKDAICALHKLCQEGNFRNCLLVEIGSYAGESTAVFAQYCRKVYAIDPWSESWKEEESTHSMQIIQKSAPLYYNTSMTEIEKIFDARMEIYPNVFKIKDFSDNVVNNFRDHSLDVVYIDSIHTYEITKRNIKLWLPKIKKNGKICGHDYNPDKWREVVQAVQEAFGQPDQIYKDRSWLIDLAKHANL